MSWISQRSAVSAAAYRYIRFIGASILQAKELLDVQKDIERSAASTPSALFKDGALLTVKVTVNGLTVTLEPIAVAKPMLGGV